MKPLDLSNLLKHAFLSGVVAARNIPGYEECRGPELWTQYIPSEPLYSRVYNALYPKDDVTSIINAYRNIISNNPELLSLLYDADLLPEQITSFRGAKSMAAVVEAYMLNSK